jgi:hypothetical protein
MAVDFQTPLARTAAQLHETFQVLTAAGFTEAQALQLLANIVRG